MPRIETAYGDTEQSWVFTDREMDGVDKRLPFFTTRNWPPCWQMRMRPSGVKAMAVGLLNEAVTCTR